MKKLKLICICMFCFFPFLCLKAQDVDFSLTRGFQSYTGGE